jgi:GPH family glycoside/pentoside/hexuronide:cation symporter
MGGLSDRTRTRWGKRRPYIIPGALGLAAGFVLLFNPPAMDSDLFAFLFLIVTYIFVNTAMTVVAVPHLALGGEISFDRDERTEVFGFRRVMSIFGSLLGLTLPAIVLSALGGESTPELEERSRHLASWLLAVPIVLSAVLTVWATRGLDASDSEPRDAISLRELLRGQLHVLRNPLFIPLLLAFVVAAVGRAINASIGLYYYEFRLGLSEETTVGSVLLPFFVFFLASIAFWVWVSKRYGKLRPALIGVGGLGALTMVVYPLFPPNSLTGPIGMAVVGGVLAGAIVLLDSMVADVVDHDELKSGRAREGLYFGVWKMGTKLSRAIGLGVAGALLSAIGFEGGATTQTDEVGWRLAILFGPVVGAFFLAGGWILSRAPLTDAKHRRVQALLLRRRATRARRRAAFDPV